jgi:hypothetical protein
MATGQQDAAGCRDGYSGLDLIRRALPRVAAEMASNSLGQEWLGCAFCAAGGRARGGQESTSALSGPTQPVAQILFIDGSLCWDVLQ